MAYNKSKHIDAAQKYLQQGKMPQAIAEYQQILKNEPKDQVTLMTLGDLFVRQGETFQAVEYFERLAKIFLNDGFTTKAIAIYKKVAKLAPEETRPLERLAELYVQQGVMSEARPLFLQLAEIHLKNHRQPEAVVLLKKLLSAEPDNLRIQIRLADLYGAMGQPKEAVGSYVDAAQRLLARGEQAEAEKLAEKALKHDAHHAGAVTVKARIYAAQSKLKEAAQQLEGVSDLEKGGEQTELLLDLYLKNSKWNEATALALRVSEADEKNFGPSQKLAEALLEADQTESAQAVIGKIHIPMLDAGEHEAVSRLLTQLVAKSPGRVEPLEWLVDAYGRASDSFRLPDALTQLGDALAAAGNLDRAKEVFEQLAEREPENEAAKRKLNDVLRNLGLIATPEPEPVAVVEEVLPTELPKPEPVRVRPESPEVHPVAAKAAPSADDQTDADTERFISQSLTDVDLFASYGLTQKAIGLLEAVLRRAPRHTPTLEKLLDFVLGTGDDRRTAELASQLEMIHRERGEERPAERFGELRRRFQRAAGLSDAELMASAAQVTVPAAPAVDATAVVEVQPAAPEMPVPPVAVPAPVAEKTPLVPETQVHEVDLSDEWSSLLEDASAAKTSATPPSKPAPPPKKEAAPPVAEAASLRAPEVSEFEIPVESAPQGARPLEELTAELSGLFVSAPPAAKSSKPAQPPPPPRKKEKPVEAEPVFEVEQDYDLVLEPESLVPAHEQMGPKPSATKPSLPGSPISSDEFLSQLASEIEGLGIGELSPEFSKVAPEAHTQTAPTSSAKQKAAPPSTAGEVEGPLKEVFEEFRAELGEMGAEEEDLETHYNLGIAFREMGLLEEAISEFQKVAKANDRGRAFRYGMQCCTLLGLAFMEKGQPAVAAHWYERALETPGIDPESTLALRYDLGVALESAGDLDAALKSFTKVYAANIDYRDVAERIAVLDKAAR
jgi:tetratricopeptide (TPR) repeat protein